ncbi:MAG TPA: multidrug effflux MFS transporter [Trinickia sp.]|uniref:multidrug effflux MFS transporter n=1 Tax=Trinickia sp. TaxID=2571163 RepID=UPI002D0ACF8E|nr:multidrug effflux MFS transporter [Trinickia sp.]HVW49714.1 multidrug effflux MFS transporter [Trinickia sp.]
MPCRPQRALDSSESVKSSLWLATLGALCAVGPLSIDMYLAATPAIAAEFGAAPSGVSRSIATYLVGVLLGQVIHGVVSDRCGRKPPLCAGLLVYSVSSFACACTSQIEWFVALRFVQGAGGSAGVVIARAMIHDRGDTRGMARSFSLLMLVVSVAPLVAPLAGSLLLDAIGWRAIFSAMGAYGVILVAVSTALPETHDRREGSPLTGESALRVCAQVFADRRFVTWGLSNGLLQGGMYAYVSLSSIVIIDAYQQPPGFFSIVFAANSLGMIVAAQINARLVMKMRLRSVVKTALWVATLSLGALAAVPGQPPLPILLAAIFVYLAAIGFVAPNSAAMALAAHADRAGAASALLGMLLYGVGALSGAVAVHVFPTSPTQAMILVMTSCSISAIMVFFWTRHDPS